MTHALAIDLGTSSVKTALVSSGGRVLRTASAAYPVNAPAPGRAETPTHEWLAACATAAREVTSGGPPIDVVGLDGQMHGVVLADGSAALAPAVTWADNRAAPHLALWESQPEATRARWCNPIAAGMYGPILAWFAANEPGLIERATSALSPKDWLRTVITGAPPVTEPSDASATLLWDVPGSAWDFATAEVARIPERLLPPVARSGDLAGTLTRDIARAWGLREGTPVAVGCADTAAALLGLGLARDQVAITMGTGIQVTRTGVTPVPDPQPRFHTYAAATAATSPATAGNRAVGHYAMVAPTNGGLVLDRVRGWLGATWEELYASLDEPPQADDPLFLPYLAAERLPDRTDGGRGAWEGLGLNTDRRALLRSVVVSQAMLARTALEALGGSASGVVVAGGGARDRRVRQLLADVLGLSVTACLTADVAARGVAILALASVGAEAVEPVELGESMEPRGAKLLEHTWARSCAARGRVP